MNDPNTKLYDEVHSIMTKELLTFFKKCCNDFESEVPYNYFGNRGSVDIVQYKTIDILHQPHSMLYIYELESQIIRLEELVRKLKDRMEYFPEYFEKSRGIPKLGEVNLFIILLNTASNWKVVNEYLVNLKSAFSRVYHTFPKDVMSKTKNPSDNNYFAQIQRASLVFFDPLRVRQFEVNEDNMNRDEILFNRIAAFQTIESWHDSVEKIRDSLNSIKPVFNSASDFLAKYKRYINN
ncbi:MAG: hypothetical protein Q8N09_10660 [Thermodesulfovibrionia bacterium]|nr:hypothetical protein [Thermodesulfovibrionia bacterium]